MEETYTKETTNRFLFLYRKLESIGETDPEKYRFYKEKYYEQFEEYRHLRNYPSHEQYGGGYPFAVSSKVVSDLSTILAYMDCLALDKAAKNVKYLSPSTSIKEAMDAFIATSYTYYPILNEKKRVLGILTSGSLLALVSTHIDLELPLGDFLDRFSLANQKTRFLFMKRTAPLYEAEKAFREVKEGKRVSLILLTEHGLASESLLGILTIYDILKSA